MREPFFFASYSEVVFLSGHFITTTSVEDNALRFDEVTEVLIGTLFDSLDVQFNSICADDAFEYLSLENDS